jgi:hypothetical protein
VNDRAFRLDFFIAIGALVISALTAGTLIYQTRVIGDQFSATIWPYLNVETTYTTANGESIELVNNGLGPALIRSAQLSLEGREMRSWDGYVLALAREDPAIRRFLLRVGHGTAAGRPVPLSIVTASIGPTTTLPAGQSKTLLKFSSPVEGFIPMKAVMAHPIALSFCYCSLNGSCWTLRTTPGKASGTPPQPTSHCATAASIESNPISLSTVRSRP